MRLILYPDLGIELIEAPVSDPVQSGVVIVHGPCQQMPLPQRLCCLCRH